MAATEKKNIFLWSSVGNNPPTPERGLITASQGIWMPNAPCYVSSSGTITLQTTSDGTADPWHGLLLGADSPAVASPILAELDENAPVRYLKFRAGDLYGVYAENSGIDSAVTQANVGVPYGFTVSSTAGEIGYTTLDLNATTNIAAMVVDIASNLESNHYTTSDAPAMAIVRIRTECINAKGD